MKLLRTTERPEQKYSLAFVGYGTNPDHAELELTYDHGVDHYDLGSAYATCERIRAIGGNVTRDARPGEGRQHGDWVRDGS